MPCCIAGRSSDGEATEPGSAVEEEGQCRLLHSEVEISRLQTQAHTRGHFPLNIQCHAGLYK